MSSVSNVIEPAPFRTCGHHLVVEVLKPPTETTTESGLMVVEDRPERPSRVFVVGAGPDCVLVLASPDGGFEDVKPTVGHELIVNRGRMAPIVLPGSERELHVIAPEHVIGVVA